MKVALIQMNAGADKQKNIDRARVLARQAIRQKAEFILLPEVFNYRGNADRKTMSSQIAESIPGESSRPFCALAKKHKVFILLGSLYEKIRGVQKIYNTSVFIDNTGRIKAKYRKMNLFEAVVDGKKIQESKVFSRGRRGVLAEVRGFKAGLSICYDVRFPLLYRRYGKAGAHIFCVPSAFTRATGKAHFATLLRARAIENLCYVLAPGQIGPGAQGVFSFGHSMVIGPWGEVLAKGSGGREEIVYADLSMDDLQTRRRSLPALHL